MPGIPRELSFLVTRNGCWEITSHKPGKSGYVHICRNGKENISVHRWVYENYFGVIPQDYVVMHMCDNKICINPAHLKIGTQWANMRDCTIKGRRPHGNKNGGARLSKEEVSFLRADYDSGINRKQIEEKYGVSKATVWRIGTRRSWKEQQC